MKKKIKSIGIGNDAPNHQIEIKCVGCNNVNFIDTAFEINIIGMLQFKCKKCKSVFNVPDVAWSKMSYSIGPNERLYIKGDGNVGI